LVIVGFSIVGFEIVPEPTIFVQLLVPIKAGFPFN